MTQIWAASHTGYSGMVTINRRVKPGVTSLEPSAGSTKGGTTVTVKGDKFYAGLTTVKLAGLVVSPVSVKSETELSFKTPAGSAGLVDLEVFNPGGVSIKLSQAFKYEAPIVKTVEVKAAADTLVANGVTSTQITVRLLDQNGELVTDETVNLLADRGTIPAQAINNKDGTYTATYKSSQTFGQANITAVTTTGGKLGKVELTLTQRQVSAEKSTVSLDRNWAMIGQQGAVLTVKVVDKQGLVMKGQTVTAKVEPADQVTVSTAKTTDKQGETQLRIQSVTAGERKVTVQVGEVVLTSTASVKFTSNQVANVLISAGGVRKVGELITVSLTLQNASQLPVSGQKVEVIVEPEEGVTLTQPTQDSDVQGKLEAKLFSQTAGLKMLKVKSGDTVLENSAAIIFQAGTAEKVKITAGKTSLMPSTTTILTVTVTDQYDNALKGEAVKLASTLGQVGTITDNEDGTYGAIFTAPDQTGQVIVTATAAAKNANLGLTVTDKPALTLRPQTAEVEKDGTLQFEASQPVLWTVKGEIGTIDNKGLFTASQLGTGSITAFLLSDPAVKLSTGTITVVEAKLPLTALVFDLPNQAEFDAELDVKGQLIVVNQPDQPAGDQAIVVTFTSPAGKELKFAARTDKEGRYVLDTVVRFNQVGIWKLGLSFAGSTQFASTQRQHAISVSKAASDITFLSAESAELGQDYQLVGVLKPAIPAVELSLQVLAPDSQLIEKTLLADAGGGFKSSFKLNLEGHWSATLNWAGSSTYQPVTRTFQLNVVQRFGKVIVALGGIGPSEVHAWPKFNTVAESVYRVFVQRNFQAEKDIYFLSPDPNKTKGAQAQTTLKTLEYAITSWAAKEVNSNVPLYIYLLSHNLGDKFLVERRGLQDDYLTPEQLDLWLDKLPPETPVTLIIEACYSGSFINSRLSAPNRTIITSASRDKQALIMRTSSFSRFFFDRIRANQTIRAAFSQTEERMKKMRAHHSQSPQIDANGNGVANELLDLQALGDRRIPADISSLSLPPAFGSQAQAVNLKPGISSHTFQVEVVGTEVERVFAEIIQPGFDPDRLFQNWQEVDQQIQAVDLQLAADQEGTPKYQLRYDKFIQPGEYTLIFQASNADGNAEPIQTTVMVSEGGQLAGDVNGDNSVNIFDLVMVAGQFGKSGAGLSGDVNDDGSVNIFDLVQVAGNFGKSGLAAAPSLLVEELTFTTQQKRDIQSAIVELKEMPIRSEVEELAFNLLKTILPERLPAQTQLLQNYPNPFNPETWIPFELGCDGEVSITIYDAVGNPVRTLSAGHLSAGGYVGQSTAVYWDGKTDGGEPVASGTYFYTLRIGSEMDTRKLIILK